MMDTHSKAAESRKLVPLSILYLAVVLVTSSIVAFFFVKATDEEMRSDILRQAQQKAEDFTPERIMHLRGTTEDTGDPRYERLKRQFILASQVRSQYESIYLLRRTPDGSLVILVDNLKPGTPDFSPPGTPFADPDGKFITIFDNAAAKVFKGAPQPQGTFVTAAVPVFSETGDLVAVLCFNDMVGDWNRILFRSTIPVLITAFCVIVVGLGGAFASYRRSVGNPGSDHAFSLIEPVCGFLIGSMLTIFAAWFFHGYSTKQQARNFEALAQSRSQVVVDFMRSTRDQAIRGLVAFFENSEDVTAAEFAGYTRHLLRDASVPLWAWLPYVPADRRAEFEASALIPGDPKFPGIWELGEAGEPRAAGARDFFAPVQFMEPVNALSYPVIGYDIASMPDRRRVLEQSVETELPRATTADPWIFAPSAALPLRIMMPIFEYGPAGSAALRGHVLTALDLQPMLERVTKAGDTRLRVSQLLPEGDSIILASANGDRAAPDPKMPGLVRTVPIFGEVLKIEAFANSGHAANYAVSGGVAALIAGGALTAALTAVLFFIGRRQETLERLVIERTHEVRRHAATLDGFFTTGVDLLCLAKTNGVIERLNPEWENLFGFKLSEMEGSLLASLVYPEDREPFLSEFSKLVSGSEARQCEVRGLTASDEIRWLSWRMLAAPDCVYVSAMDVTERRRMQEALESERDFLEQIMATSVSAITVLDRSGRIIFANEAAKAVFGMSGDSVRKRRFDAPDWQIEDPDGGPFPAEELPFNKVRSTGAPVWDVRHAIRWPDGSRRIVSVNAAPMTNKGGRTTRVVCAITDITQDVESRRDLAASRQAADAANRAKSEFLANMSHEIRTPMNGIIGVTELLMDSGLNDEQHSFVEIIHQSGLNLLEIINSILDLSKIEAGAIELAENLFSPGDLLTEVYRNLQPLAMDKHLPVSVRIDPESPEHVYGDHSRIRQILLNLLGNAIKFTSSGGISFGLVVEGRVGSQVHLRFEVIDTGIGIPPEKLDLLFRKFSQVDGSTTRQYGGTGLGLAIAKELVVRMGGEIGCFSPIQASEWEVERPAKDGGVGAVFWFRLCLKTENLSPRPEIGLSGGDTAEPAAPASRIRLPQPANPLLSKRILVVEDNPINQAVMRGILEKLGFKANIVSNGYEALAFLDQGGADLIFMDIQMPRMNGFETAAAIRSARSGANYRSIPIIAMTANAMEGDSEECLAAGMNDYLAKPSRPSQILEMIRKWLEEKTEDNED